MAEWLLTPTLVTRTIVAWRHSVLCLGFESRCSFLASYPRSLFLGLPALCFCSAQRRGISFLCTRCSMYNCEKFRCGGGGLKLRGTNLTLICAGLTFSSCSVSLLLFGLIAVPALSCNFCGDSVFRTNVMTFASATSLCFCIPMAFLVAGRFCENSGTCCLFFAGLAMFALQCSPDYDAVYLLKFQRYLCLCILSIYACATYRAPSVKKQHTVWFLQRLLCSTTWVKTLKPLVLLPRVCGAGVLLAPVNNDVRLSSIFSSVSRRRDITTFRKVPFLKEA